MGRIKDTAEAKSPRRGKGRQQVAPGASASAGSRERRRSSRGRSCVGCGAQVPLEQVRSDLIHLVLVPGDESWGVVVDLAGKSVGRGAWVHARAGCVARACSKGLARSARRRVIAEREQLAADIVSAAARRLESLVGTARRAGHVAVGAAAVERAWTRGQVRLLIVAKDAAAAARLPVVRQAVQQGVARAWGDKQRWGSVVREPGASVAVLAVLSDSIAVAARHAVNLAEQFACPAWDEGSASGSGPAPGADSQRSGEGARGGGRGCGASPGNGEATTASSQTPIDSGALRAQRANAGGTRASGHPNWAAVAVPCRAASNAQLRIE